MFEKVWSVRGLTNINRNAMSVYVLKLLSLRKIGSFFIIYRPPSAGNLTDFFEEMTTSLTKAMSNYENIIVMGDFNIDIKCKGVGSNNLSDFCDLFHLTNIVKSDTCFPKTHASLIDWILTNKPSSFNP